MLRLAAISDDLDTRVDRASAIAADAGLDGLSVRNVEGVNVRDLDDSALRQTASAVRGAGLEVVAVSSPIGRNVTLDDDDASTVSLLERMIRAAGLLGTDLIRVFATWMPGRDAVGAWSARPPEIPDAAIERMTRYARRAERAGVRLMLELEGASVVGTGLEASLLFGQVRSPALCLCWDVCNAWWSGELPWEDSWQSVRALPIVDVQTKDVRAAVDDPMRAGLRQVELGTGDIPYERILAALVDDGYGGWVTAERVYHPRRPEDEPELRNAILADIAALRMLADRATADRRENAR